MKRNRLLAIVGAGVLAMGVVGVALAEELNSGQVGKTLGEIVENQQDCTDFDELEIVVGPGEIGVHFVLTTPDGGATSALLDASFSTDSVNDLPNTPKNSTTLHFYAVITGDMDTVINSASTNIDGGNLNVSHVCGGETVTTTSSEETTTSFSSSEESTTETSSEETTTSSEETTTSSEETTTSFSSSELSTTDSQSSSTSFTDSVNSSTTQPPSDTLGETGQGQQSGSMWLLLAALGALGGSLIVLAPSKAKNRD